MFTSLDAASGFWQIPLHPESSKLTTFITPFGRYAFKRLPFGITSAPEIFQRKMAETLSDLDGVAIYMDDILVYGNTAEQHDERLSKVLERIESTGLKLNKDKCVFRQNQLHFLGQVIDKSGVKPDPDKVKAIKELPEPQNVQDLKRVLGMFTYLGKYIPHLSTVGQPLYELLRSKTTWTWDHPQKEAFQRIKDILSTSPVLKFYDVNRPTAVSADASSYGIGGVLLQQHDGDWKPIAYCSRRLSDAETRYAQIEKECLASVWACERFEKYLVGLESFKLVTDHKPLVPLMTKKDLDNVPIRCQRLLMRLMRFKPTAEYAPGKTLTVADTLSRSPLQSTFEESDTHSDVQCYIAAVVSSVPASPQKLETIRLTTAADSNLQTILDYIRSGWPEYVGNVPIAIRDYYPVKSELSEYNGIITRGSRILIPSTLRTDILDRIHDGHQGLTKCRERANTSVWWPGISTDIKNKVESCQTCREMKHAQRKEPLISTLLPDRPWQRLAIDLCDYNKHTYLVVSDYFSRFIEILHMPTTTASQVVLKLKTLFARYGCPDEVVSDNGPQFACAEFQDFARNFDFQHITSSPHNPQANGHAERGVQIAKRILAQKDPLLALMCYRSTPCATTGVSPAELLMGRRIKSTLPTLETNLRPQWPDLQSVRSKDAKEKQKQAFYFNQRHGSRPLPPLKPGDSVLTKLDHQNVWGTPAVVTGDSTTPRSYDIVTDQGATLRRNRRHLLRVPASSGTAQCPLLQQSQHEAAIQQAEPAVAMNTQMTVSNACPSPMQDGQLYTRSGRLSRPVNRLNL
uniref:Gypsy retrotransposon integrase-like protein 1 n=1 Tax=Acanthochromis polyacanthus TaxID=80966 RepID=A0A3Q1EIG7_9TELE